MKLINRIIRSLNLRYKAFSIKRSIRVKQGTVKGVRMVLLGNIEVGNHVVLTKKGIDTSAMSQIYVGEHGSLKINDYVGLSQSSIYCYNSIQIGKHVDIGAGCLIFDSNFHSIDWRLRENRLAGHKSAKTAPVIIGDNAFIGTRCIICKGVEIGARSVIAAGSVVVKSIPEDCIAGGNPCKVIKKL